MPRVVHFEIHAENPERAAAFYGQLFGWSFTKYQGPLDYWLIQTGVEGEPGINGGLMRRIGAPPVHGQAVNAYVCTIDVAALDDRLERAVSLGAVVALPKMAVPGVGWLAYAIDPEGNIFGMMQADTGAA